MTSNATFTSETNTHMIDIIIITDTIINTTNNNLGSLTSPGQQMEQVENEKEGFNVGCAVESQGWR